MPSGVTSLSSVSASSHDVAVRYGRSFIWRCRSCDQAISDRGLIAGPADDEMGHTEDCPRLAAAVAEWDASWEAEP